MYIRRFPGYGMSSYIPQITAIGTISMLRFLLDSFFYDMSMS